MLRVISQLFVIIRKVQKHLALFLLGHPLCNVSELFSPKPMVFGHGSIFLHLTSDLWLGGSNSCPGHGPVTFGIARPL